MTDLVKRMQQWGNSAWTKHLHIGPPLEAYSLSIDCATAAAELAALREEVEDQAGLIKRLSDLLNSAVNVLRGPPPDDTLWSFHDVAERAEALRARVAELEADAEAGRKLWSYMVENELPWSDPDLQDALTDIGLLVAKDMRAEGSGPECDNCIGDCGTCYRVSKTLLVQRATESAGGGHVHD